MITKQDHEKYIIAHFKWWAPIYRMVELFVGKTRKVVVQIIGNKPQKVLDVACGPGSLTFQLARAGHNVTGVDISPDMLRFAKRDDSLNMRYIQGDATSLEFSDSVFDASTISFGLHDMPENIAIEVLSEMKRVTKNQGTIVIVEYNRSCNSIFRLILRISRLWETRYYWSFIQSGLEKYLSAVGLKIEHRKKYLFGISQVVIIINKKISL